ncbi:unnamed protein product [Notodromas monacha]|uniref:Uncharacterized protein n=1 Tax=Notodromas monacha TaxID=399045 RepID=A0A7R9BSS8_9CRUS|nr:unnamed protein product [Notodromas monacha]CAG0920028.1 unnamed protein product [Notodromas monacha]
MENQELISKSSKPRLASSGQSARNAVGNEMHDNRRGKCVTCMMILSAIVAGLLLFVILSVCIAKAVLPYPAHASCQVNITFFGDQYDKALPICDAVKNALLGNVTENELQATHQTNDAFGFIDAMHFKFLDSPRGDCLVEAFSTSTVFFAYLDFSVIKLISNSFRVNRMASLVTKVSSQIPKLVDRARPNVQWFMRYAKVELTPPTPGEIPIAIKQFTQLLASAGRGKWQHVSVREAWLNTLVTFEVFCWFFIGECIGKRNLVGYNV